MSVHRGARDNVRATVEADPWGVLEELREVGTRKAKAEGIAYYLEHQRKILLSRLAGEIAQVQSNKNLSETKLERLARADPRYEAHIKGAAVAVEEKEAAHAEYWRLRAELEWMDKTVSHANALTRLER